MTTEEHPLITQYRRFSPRSDEYAVRARQSFPGGDTRSSAHFEPYPLLIEKGEGCVLTDADGNQLIDFMNNFTSLVHGHAFAPVVEAVQKQIAMGSAYAAPSESQVELAELVINRIPSIEQIRFTSSGTEATQLAIRCARAATGRQKIMKMEGGYHGSYETAEVSLVPRPDNCGPLEAPNSTPVDASFPDSVLKDTIICPFNQPALAENLIAQHGDQIAAVIVEPMLGSMGMVQATTEFLELLRKVTESRGIVLIFDEVISLRLNQGGLQSIHQVQPDLTCLGKIIGGGLPIGGIGGRRDLLQLFSPTQPKPVMHASTFSGNALSMAAGLAAMQCYTQTDCDRINGLGVKLRAGFNEVFNAAAVRVHAGGYGSLCKIHFTDREVTDSRGTVTGIREGGNIPALLHLTMLRHGVSSASRLMYCISTAMGETEIEKAIAALDETLQELLPHIEKEQPNLLV